MEARQRAQLTGTNRSFDLIALVAKARACESARGRRMTARRTDRPCVLRVRRQVSDIKPVLLRSDVRGRTTGDGKPSLPSSVSRPPSSEPSFAGLVALARRSDPIPSRTRPSNAFAPMVLCLKTWESRSSPGLQRTEIGQQMTDVGEQTIGKTADRRRLTPKRPTLPLSRLKPNDRDSHPSCVVRPPFSDCRGVEQPGSSSGS